MQRQTFKIFKFQKLYFQKRTYLKIELKTFKTEYLKNHDELKNNLVLFKNALNLSKKRILRTINVF